MGNLTQKIKNHNILSGLFSIVMGLILILLRGRVLSLVITVIGIGFIASAFAFGVKRISGMMVLKIMIGICTIAFGNTFINLSMYILGIALIVFGIFRFISANTIFKQSRKARYALSLFMRPALTLVAGIFILFNPMESVESLFFICGILLAAGGLWDLSLGLKIRV